MTGVDVRLAEGRPAPEVLAWSRGLVEPAVRAAVGELPPSMRRIAGYHLGWWDEHGHPARVNGGKAIRPALAMLSAAAVGAAADAAVPAAVAVELVHNHTLLHDDVMDGDLTRRHRPTAWSVFGVNAAILAGDALLALALDVLAGSGHTAAIEGTRMLSAAVQALLDGQSADLSFETRVEVEPAECVRMAEGKTAALLGCACALGALFGGAGAERAGCLRAFGVQLGLAFQHVDDLLGIWGDPAVTGKPVHSDLRSHKKSLPVVAALNSPTAAGRELAALYHRQEPLSETDLVHAAELIERAGGRAWSQAQADDLVARAMRDLARANPAPRAAAELGSLAQLATHRDC
ncbi:MAG TPA: family 2 encapsulin nanocompartment cargo protein polyprenyl transferase [Pseudonocardiaceae bacterium]|nr:family 2 encapsulin nanocompartment cargo protein polyprenyl transferase [Pseudonocardiaceae bacterium]